MRRPRFRFRIRRIFVILCTLTLCTTLWLGNLTGHRHTAVNATDVRQLVESGVGYYQAGDYPAAIADWQLAYEVYKATQDLPSLAIVSENLAWAHQQTGQTSQEVTYWEDAIAAVQRLNDTQKLGRLLTQQAQAYSRLGQHRRAIAILCGAEGNTCVEGSALHIAQHFGDQTAEVAALGTLGEAYRMSGNREQARTYLLQGREISLELGDNTLEANILNSLGNTLAALAQVNYRRADEAESIGNRSDVTPFRDEASRDNGDAIGYFEESYALAEKQKDLSSQVRVLLSLIPAYERANNLNKAGQLWQLAFDDLPHLPDAKFKAFAAIQLSDLLDPPDIRQAPTRLNAIPPDSEDVSQATDLLNQALAIGKHIQNDRIQSFAWGKLGNLDERLGQEHLTEALEKTQEAIIAADQDIGSRDSLYLWEWQMGRIFRRMGKATEATEAYSQAVAVLEEIRSDILNANQDLQFDFRDRVEPIYRQYTDLNLDDVPDDRTLNKNDSSFAKLDTALEALDSLKVAELQNYFANDCIIIPTATRVDDVGDSVATAVVSTAILDDKLAIILSLPNDNKRVAQSFIQRDVLVQQINDFRISLESGLYNYSYDDKEAAEHLYNSLIRPFENNLVNVKTLVFVNDGLLRSIPMAALYDGEKYLVERFAVATTPSLTLTNPKRLERPSLNALLLGVSAESQVPGRFFDPLPAVNNELEKVSQLLPNSEILLNEQFSIEALRQALQEKDYRILHIATHGTFGYEPEDNFVVAGAKQMTEAGEYNEKLTISQLDELIREVSGPTRDPIELLTLTACETAIGDNRSTLGLAGVAVRAGVRSAVATLWSVSDESSAELISQFYENLQDPALTKAEALQRAQISLLNSDDFVKAHPFRWAPFTLIGNWL